MKEYSFVNAPFLCQYDEGAAVRPDSPKAKRRKGSDLGAEKMIEAAQGRMPMPHQIQDQQENQH
jgi:hypothetical protein